MDKYGEVWLDYVTMYMDVMKDGEWYKADEVADLAKRGLKYHFMHDKECSALEMGKRCNCGRDNYIAELEQIAKEGEDEEV